MTNVAENIKWMPQARYLGPARILEVDTAQQRALLRLAGSASVGDVWSKIAIAGPLTLQEGDLALVVGEDIADLYLIGIIKQETSAATPEEKVVLRKGTTAEVAGPPEAQNLQVFSPKRELLFEYDEKKGRARVNLEAGDLEFVTRKGNITFAAGKAIHFHGQSIGLTSTRNICLGLVDALGKLRSKFTLEGRKAKLFGPQVEIAAERGDFNIDDARHTSKRVTGKLGHAKVKADRLDSVVATVISRAKNVFNTVEQLQQVKAGRMRTLIANTFHFKSKKAILKAEEDYKINADKIHLG